MRRFMNIVEAFGFVKVEMFSFALRKIVFVCMFD